MLHDVGCVGDSRKCIFQQGLAEPGPFLAFINGEPRQQDDWDGMSGKSLADPSGRFLGRDASGGDRIVADYCRPRWTT